VTFRKFAIGTAIAFDDEDYRDNRQWERNTFRWLMRYMVNLSSSDPTSR
jgi:hypothetical protein